MLQEVNTPLSWELNREKSLPVFQQSSISQENPRIWGWSKKSKKWSLEAVPQLQWAPWKFLAPRNEHHSQRCASSAHIRVLFVCAFCTKHLCLSVQLVVLQVYCNVTNCSTVIKLLLPNPSLSPSHAATQTADMPRVILVHYTLRIY